MSDYYFIASMGILVLLCIPATMALLRWLLHSPYFWRNKAHKVPKCQSCADRGACASKMQALLGNIDDTPQ